MTVLDQILSVCPNSQEHLKVHVHYLHLNNIKNGQHVTKEAAAEAPKVTFGGEEGKLYTLVMVDPDAPNPDNPKMAEWLHWIVVDIPSHEPASHGRTLVEYNGPTPPRGEHRYIFFVFKQPGTAPLKVEPITERAKFSTLNWSQSHNLGEPEGAVFFYTSP